MHLKLSYIEYINTQLPQVHTVMRAKPNLGVYVLVLFS